MVLYRIEGKTMKNIDSAFYSDIGGRPNNEDSYLNRKMDNFSVFVVADGLGGHNDGEVASYIAVKSIQESMIDNANDDIFTAIEYANAQVIAQQKETMSKMKTTIAMTYIKEEETIIAHVGDSRVYAFKDGKVIFQTLDHSASQMAVAVGEITLDEIRNHEDRNRLTRVLGASEEIKIDAVSIQNDQYDALLICSDGFWEYVLEEEMEETLVGSDSAINWLYKMRTIQANRAPENCDNNTAIVIRNVIE